MAIRSFDWRDLPRLHTYRNETLYLHTALLLTRGPLQTLGAVLSSVVPTIGIYTAVSEDPEQPEAPLIGQVIHETGEPFAHLTFLAPESQLGPRSLPPLIEHLAVLAAGHGALRILAEVDEHTPALDGLRRATFAVYTRQRTWRLAEKPGGEAASPWRAASSQDLFGIRLLYSSLVPGMVQQVEPVSLGQPRGLVYHRGGELRAYVELQYGLRGIWARPYIHPDVEEATPELVALLQRLPARYNRPVYLCVSAYQSWLESVLEDLGAQPGARQVLMVKHLTVQKRLERPATIPVLEGQTETLAFTTMEHG